LGGEEPPPSEETPWARSPEDEEAEPDWAEQIRTSRKDRGEKLREVYSRFAEESTPLDDTGDEGDAE
jgi:hypothetical protein